MPIRLLLIDDSPVDRELASRALRELAAPPGPAEVVEADSWAHAQPHLAAGSFDLMLLDYHLPDLDGLTILHELERRPHPPVIMMTGQSDLAVAVATLRSGADEYVPKAADVGATLCLAVERVIQRAGLERELAASRARLEAYAVELEAKIEARTAMVRAQAAEIEALYLRSEEAARVKSDIIANLSHELRTPLSIIVGYHELLEEELPPRDVSEARDILARVRSQVDRLREVVQSLLTLAQLRAGTVGVTVSHFTCASLLDELSADAASLNADKGLALAWRSATPSVEVEHDREKIRAVAYHLLSNAIKFTDSGSVTLTLQADADGGMALTVADTGVGFPPDARGLIFEDFRQLDGSSTRRFDGLGLGLGIVRRYATLLGGTIALDSAPGTGTTVRVQFPHPAQTSAVTETAVSSPSKRLRRTRRKPVIAGDLVTSAVRRVARRAPRV